MRWGLCLACTDVFDRRVNAFCFWCKAPRPLHWTTGNKSLDSFITESWSNVKVESDAYIQWIEYSILTHVQEMTSLRRECTHRAYWVEPTMRELVRVIFKKIVDGQNAQSFDFYQVNYFTRNNANNINNSVTSVFVYSNS